MAVGTALSDRPSRHLFRRRRGPLGRLAVALAAMAMVWQPRVAQSADWYFHQTYSAAGAGTLHVVDFHYPSREACVDGLSRMRGAMAQRYPTYQYTSGACEERLTPVLRAMQNNERLPVAYLSFQDMRQWMQGVDAGAAAKFCVLAASAPQLKSGARCVR